MIDNCLGQMVQCLALARFHHGSTLGGQHGLENTTTLSSVLNIGWHCHDTLGRVTGSSKRASFRVNDSFETNYTTAIGAALLTPYSCCSSTTTTTRLGLVSSSDTVGVSNRYCRRDTIGRAAGNSNYCFCFGISTYDITLAQSSGSSTYCRCSRIQKEPHGTVMQNCRTNTN